MNGIKDWSDRPPKENKGKFEGDCNVSACSNKDATWYNKSTRAYYCASCARRINSENFIYIKENLCTNHEQSFESTESLKDI